MEKVAQLSKLKAKMCISVKGKKLALFKIGKKVYCIDNTCTHAGGPLCEGDLDGTIITCPWHGSKFDVKTGKVVGPPAKKPVKNYKVTIKGGEVFVDV
ncbi:MAG TPA: non-heme iron oxygenase ferredoxin subunit [Candidatus Nanoarchaeia archaeon]|nr:non-heme iron oxygenase ferredoxin subunit [Candidatus Nanoarchaeia archaeon]